MSICDIIRGLKGSEEKHDLVVDLVAKRLRHHYDVVQTHVEYKGRDGVTLGELDIVAFNHDERMRVYEVKCKGRFDKAQEQLLRFEAYADMKGRETPHLIYVEANGRLNVKRVK